MTQSAGRHAHDHHGRVDVAGLPDARIDKHAAHRRNFHRILGEQEPRHVEIVDRHVPKQPSGDPHVFQRGRRRIPTRDHSQFDGADLAGNDSIPDRGVTRIETPVESDLNGNASILNHARALIHARDIQMDRFLAEHCLASACRSLDQVAMRVGSGSDQHSVNFRIF